MISLIIYCRPLNKCCNFSLLVREAFFSLFSICIPLVRIIHSVGQGESTFPLQRVTDKWCPPMALHDELVLLHNRLTIHHRKSICFGKKNGAKRFYSIGCNGELSWSIRWIMCILKYCVNTYFYNSLLHFQRSHRRLHLKWEGAYRRWALALFCLSRRWAMTIFPELGRKNIIFWFKWIIKNNGKKQLRELWLEGRKVSVNVMRALRELCSLLQSMYFLAPQLRQQHYMNVLRIFFPRAGTIICCE